MIIGLLSLPMNEIKWCYDFKAYWNIQCTPEPKAMICSHPNPNWALLRVGGFIAQPIIGGWELPLSSSMTIHASSHHCHHCTIRCSIPHSTQRSIHPLIAPQCYIRLRPIISESKGGKVWLGSWTNQLLFHHIDNIWLKLISSRQQRKDEGLLGSGEDL